DRQQLEGSDAEHHHAEHQQRGRDRAADEGFGNAPRLSPPALADGPGGAALMRAPSTSRNWPLTTTRSPGTSPRVTAATPSWTAATSIDLRCTVSSCPTT